MAPTLTTSYPIHSGGNNSNTLTTTSFTPSAGEVLVAKLGTWDTGTNFGTGPSGGGLAWTKQIEAAPGGFSAYAAIWTAVVGGSPSSMTVSATPSLSSYHTMTLERWVGQLAATPAVNSTIFGNGTACSFGVTTAASSSVVTWTVADANSKSPATRTYLSSATEVDLYDASSGANGVWYFAYQGAPTAGSQTCGLSAPTGMIWSAAGIEIQSSSSPSVTVQTKFRSNTARFRAACW